MEPSFSASEKAPYLSDTRPSFSSNLKFTSLINHTIYIVAFIFLLLALRLKNLGAAAFNTF